MIHGNYLPDVGDLIWTDFDPPTGREQGRAASRACGVPGRLLLEYRAFDRLSDNDAYQAVSEQRRSA